MPDNVEDRLKAVERDLRELKDRFDDVVRVAHANTEAVAEVVELPAKPKGK